MFTGSSRADDHADARVPAETGQEGPSRGRQTPTGQPVQAALILPRNLSTSARSAAAWRPSFSAEARTSPDTAPVSWAASFTPVILLETAFAPFAASCTLRVISRVAAPCSSTAAAMAV